MEMDSKQLKKGLVDKINDKGNEEELKSIKISMDPNDNQAGHESNKGLVFFGSLEEEKPGKKKAVPPPPPSFWQVEYYQEYFDISTETAIRRTIRALWPFKQEPFSRTETKPDLYVPIWTFITLIITMSTFGNIVHAIKAAHTTSKPVSYTHLTLPTILRV